VSLYGLVIALAVASIFALRFGTGWTQRWRLWMFDEPSDRRPRRKNGVLT
jgi:hypothetical protein